MRLVGLIRRETGLEVALRDVFAHPTVQALAAVLDACSKEGYVYNPMLPLRTTGKQSPLFCIHPAGGLATVYQILAAHLDPDIPVYGLQAKGVERSEPPHNSIEDMARCYIEAIRTIQPDGPYRLLGWSFGGTVALEMASQLESSGAIVEAIVLIDTNLEQITDDQPDIDEDQIFIEVMKDLGFDIGELNEYDLKQKAVDLLVEQRLLPPGADVKFIERIMQTMLRASRMVLNQSVKNIQTSILYFKASNNTCLTVDARLGGITLQNFIIEPIDEEHGKMCSQEASSAMMAQRINRYFAQR
jgi:thioesterase domain-containing protein